MINNKYLLHTIIILIVLTTLHLRIAALLLQFFKIGIQFAVCIGENRWVSGSVKKLIG